MKNIRTIRFPNGAQSSSFFGALATALLPSLGYTEEIPFFCAQKNSYCIECGNCNGSSLSKHQDQLYHDYITFTGAALGWGLPEDRKIAFQIPPGTEEAGIWPDAFFEYIMGIAGFSWRRLPAGAKRGDIFDTVSASVDQGYPVLLRLGGGVNWSVVTGYENDGGIYGITCDETPVQPDDHTPDGINILTDCYAHFSDAIVLTGRREPTVTPRQILRRMISALELPAHAALEREIHQRIDQVNPDTAASTVKWLNSRADIPIEDRYHVASCTDKTLPNMIGGEEIREELFLITRQYVFDNDLDATHGTLWKIWRLLGVSPWVDAHPPEEILRPEIKQSLKRLFSIVFENDRFALERLRRAEALLPLG